MTRHQVTPLDEDIWLLNIWVCLPYLTRAYPVHVDVYYLNLNLIAKLYVLFNCHLKYHSSKGMGEVSISYDHGVIVCEGVIKGMSASG